MSFFDDFVTVVKDIGTSATRIVTDTAIDLANVATGLQFDEEMEKAKQSMKDAGIYSASDAIERGQYGFLKDMEVLAQSKYQSLTEIYRTGDQLVTDVNSRTARLFILTDQLDVLAREWDDYEAVYAKLNSHPEWIKYPNAIEIKLIPLNEINNYKTKWQEAGKWIASTSLATNAATLVSSLTGLAAAARAAQLLKLSRLGQVARFTKLANVAGKASLVLTVASIGLDIGLTVAQLEDKKNRLESYLRDVDAELARANREIADLKDKLVKANALIAKVIETAGLKNEADWEGWFDSELTRVRESKKKLITITGSIERAQKLVEVNRDCSKDRLVQMILASEPQLEGMASNIVDRVLRLVAA